MPADLPASGVAAGGRRSAAFAFAVPARGAAGRLAVLLFGDLLLVVLFLLTLAGETLGTRPVFFYLSRKASCFRPFREQNVVQILTFSYCRFVKRLVL